MATESIKRVYQQYKTKNGGKEYDENDFKTSWEPEHNNRIEYTLYKPVLNAEVTAYIRVKADSDSDEVSLKLRGGEHNDDHAKAGCCYIAGVTFDGKPHLAKEYPHHEITPKFPNRVKIASGMHNSIGDIRDKWIGLKVVIYNKDDNKVQIEEYIDTDGLEDHGNKPANNWKLWWTATDDGHWNDGQLEHNHNAPGGHTFMELQGHKDGGSEERVMFRLDRVSKDTKFKFASVREIDSPPKKANH
jgi:hypothetical protein